MDEQLAQIYGTNQTYDAEDVEKTAAAELLVKIAEEQGVDLNDFSDEDIAEMLSELYSDETEKTAEEAAQEEANEKVAEADFLGRVMAHAMVQEVDNIEKEAMSKADVAKHGKQIREAIEGARYAKGAKVEGGPISRAKAWLRGRKAEHHRAGEELRQAFQRHDLKSARKAGLKGEAAESAARSGPGLKERLTHLGRAAKHVAPELAAGGVAAGGAGAALAARHKEKKSYDAAFEDAALTRAAELAAEAGWVDQDGDLMVPQEKVAADEAQALDIRALQILEENGYPVEWNQ